MAAFFAKISLLLILWGLFLFWWAEWLIYPTSAWTDYKNQAIKNTSSDFLGLNGPYYLMWTLPVFLFAMIALLLSGSSTEISRQLESSLDMKAMPYKELLIRRRTSELPKWRQFLVKISSAFWTQPILVRTPMGVLTVVDLLVISLVGFTFLWIFCYPLLPSLDKIDAAPEDPTFDRWMNKLGRVGHWTGRGWYICAHGSPLPPHFQRVPVLRLLNVPFEHAVRYLRWLGHFSLRVWILWTHSIVYSLHMYLTSGEVRTPKAIFEWVRYGCSLLAGVISMLAGIVMWNFVMLFFIDRFLRAVQSRKAISVLSAQVLPSGLIKLKFPKSPSLKYSALGMIYINMPSVSNFHCTIHSAQPRARQRRTTRFAGGVGITPFMAIIRDLLCRYERGQESLPENVELIWCVPREKDLGTLRDLSPAQIYPEFTTSKQKINVRCFVTRENIGDSKESKAAGGEAFLPFDSEETVFSGTDHDQPRKEVTHIGESNLWIAAVIAAATTGFIIIFGIFHIAIVRPNNHSDQAFFYDDMMMKMDMSGASDAEAAEPQGKAFPTVLAVTFLFVSMFLGVVVFGGAVVLAWMWSKRSLSKTSFVTSKSSPNLNSVTGGATDLEENQPTLLDQAAIVGGSRPSIAGLFEDVVEKHSDEEELCVLVSGPESLQEGVACACRSRNFRYCNTQFQFYSTSFDL
ncbi:hypothetical protein R1sor_023626 [Riccia sorocarpa]|uniref:Ferric reductase NAD binding domain-containing protein n=1 Tax=Riccia sorocarpa TaxID=122646 RepID=A0ABD3GN69_9MARC